jgi:hypothetical protein
MVVVAMVGASMLRTNSAYSPGFVIKHNLFNHEELEPAIASISDVGVSYSTPRYCAKEPTPAYTAHTYLIDV